MATSAPSPHPSATLDKPASGPVQGDGLPEFLIAQGRLSFDTLIRVRWMTLAGESAGKGPGPESSILKIKGTEIQQRLTELALEAAGHYGAPYLRDAPHNLGAIGPADAEGSAGRYFNNRKTSIYGGSNEIQRNIIAKVVLGL